MKGIVYLFIIILLIIPETINSQSRPTGRTPRENEKGRINHERPSRIQRQSNPEIKTRERKNPLRKERKPIQKIQIEVVPVFYEKPKPKVFICRVPSPKRPSGAYKKYEKKLSDLDYYSEEIEKFPEDTVLFYLRGIVKIKYENYSGAIEDLSTYLIASPDDEEAYYQRGLAFLFNSDRRNAFLDFQFSDYLGYDKSEEILKKYF